MAGKFEKPPAGLHPAELAAVGLQSAQKKIAAAYPELNQKSPAGFNPLQWAALGLKSAQEEIVEVAK